MNEGAWRTIIGEARPIFFACSVVYILFRLMASSDFFHFRYMLFRLVSNAGLYPSQTYITKGRAIYTVIHTIYIVLYTISPNVLPDLEHWLSTAQYCLIR